MSRWPVPRSDLILAAGLTVLGQVELVLAGDQVQGPAWAQHVGFALMTIPVAGRRATPLPAVLVSAAGLLLQTWAGSAPVVAGFLAILVLLASLGYHASRRDGLIGVGAMLLAGASYELLGGPLVLGDLIVNVLILCFAWFGARRIRLHSDARVQAEIAADRAARDAVTAERTRIARDLHDSIAHTLTLIALKAAVTREATETERAAQRIDEHTRDAAVEAFGSVEDLARTGLGDMHRFLHVLGADGDQEAPGIADLPSLIEGVQRSGHNVSLTVEGPTDQVPGSIGTTAYRVVQEALTNSVKHAASRSTCVRLAIDPDRVTVAVTDEGPSAHPTTPGAGRGLSGLAERVHLFGGRLTAGAGEDGHGWVVTAELPLRTGR
jgi:signal transduction histidine kinase